MSNQRVTMPKKRSGEIGEASAAITRIILVDQAPVVRLGLRALFDSQPDLHVVDEAGSCTELLAHLDAAQPDVVLLDPELEDMCGSKVLAGLRERHPGLPILVFSAHASDWRVVETVRTGVQGYLTKRSMPAAILEATRAVAAGGCYLDPKVTSLVMGHVGRAKERRRSGGRHLTARERAVLGLLAQGKRNKEISESLYISERTVKFHMSALLQKLQATNRTEVVRKAISQGLISP